MTRRLRRLLIVAAALATAGFAVALAMRPGDAGRAIDAYVLFLGALGVLALTRLTSRFFHPPTESRLQAALKRQRPAEPRVAELTRIERELEMAMESAYDTYYRLRPILRELATTRLACSAVELDRTGGRAEELLGPDAWAFVRPDLERPSDHHAPGARLREIERAVEALERVGR